MSGFVDFLLGFVVGIVSLFFAYAFSGENQKLVAARDVIREFVYPNAPMTPEQKKAWEGWLKYV